MNTTTVFRSHVSVSAGSFSRTKQRIGCALSKLRQFALIVAFTLFSSATVVQADTTIEKVNLNKANSETLQYIPGVGPSKATAIIQLRDQRGEFKSMTELLEVKGIGEKLLENLKQYGTLEGGVSELTQKMIDNPPTKKLTLLHRVSDSKLG